MSRRSVFVVGASAALGMVLGASTLAVAQFNPWNNNNVNMRSLTDNWSAPTAVGQLASNEGIYVDMKEFKINKGAAKGDPQAQLRSQAPERCPMGRSFSAPVPNSTSWTAGHRPRPLID